MKIYAGAVAISFFVVSVFVSGCGDGDACVDLQEHFDDCCRVCGPQDSYCDFNALGDETSSCEDELREDYAQICVCD